jgi:splicing factor 3B subunit 3
MFMYSLTLQPPGMITQAIVGNFMASRPKEQQILTAQAERLTLNSVDKKTGVWKTILSHNVFGILRNISACRIPGTPSGMYFRPQNTHRFHN